MVEVDDAGIVILRKFMAKPGTQFMIRKEIYVRVQKAFDEARIPFARKQQRNSVNVALLTPWKLGR